MTGPSDRTELLLHRLAASPLQTPLSELLAPGRVTVHVSDAAVRCAQGQFLASGSINLLARLYPVVQHLAVVAPSDGPLLCHAPRWQGETFAAHLKTLLETLKLSVQWEITRAMPAASECVLVIGDQGGDVGQSACFIGSDGWEVYFSPTDPMPVGSKINPVGAYAAAAFAAGEIWKRLLGGRKEFHQSRIKPQLEPLTFNTFDYLSKPGGDNPALPKEIDLGHLTIVGVGAGGGATAYTLASLPAIRGRMVLVDEDEIDSSNLNRYIMADSRDAAAHRKKVAIARDLFTSFADLDVQDLPVPFAMAQLQTADLRYVLAAVHSREARREIQLETPKVLWDAGASEDGAFRIWRLVLGQTECMYCKHPTGAEDPEHRKATQIAALLGLDHDVCLRKIKDHEPFTELEVAAVADRIHKGDLQFDPPVVGQRFNDWEQTQCGRLPLGDADDEVPIPFAPVMAGVLITGEIIKERCFPAAVLKSRYTNTLMGKFMDRAWPQMREPRPNCSFCNDPDYVSQFRRRWQKPE